MLQKYQRGLNITEAILADLDTCKVIFSTKASITSISQIPDILNYLLKELCLSLDLITIYLDAIPATYHLLQGLFNILSANDSLSKGFK